MLAIQATGETDPPVSAVTFCLPSVVTIPPGKEPAGDLWRLCLRVYAMDRLLARNTLAEHGPQGQGLYQRVRTLKEQGKARLETVVSLPCLSGQRGTNSRSIEILQGKEGSDHWQTLEQQDVGWELEVDPVLGAERRWVDVNLSLRHQENRGPLQGHDLLRQQLPNPVLSSRSLVTSTVIGTRDVAFLGTLNAPQDTGVNQQADRQQASLVFLEVRLPGS